MLRATALLCVAFGSLFGLSPAGAEKPAAAPAERAPQPVEPKPHPVLITAELDRVRAHPGDAIRLTELVPRDREIKVQGFWHMVYIVGKYDLTLNALVNLDPERPRHTMGDRVFDEWPGNPMAAGDRHFSFRVTNPRQEGFEFEFKARQIGIYLIKTEWWLLRSKEVIESNPVILTVTPPLDKDGKPIIKEEWIDPIHWEHRPR